VRSSFITSRESGSLPLVPFLLQSCPTAKAPAPDQRQTGDKKQINPQDNGVPFVHARAGRRFASGSSNWSNR
jgi:hypothetical protein